MHDWQTLALESLQATMFTMSLQAVDRYMIQRSARPGSVLTFPEQVERCRQMGEHIGEAMETPVEERTWLGDPDTAYAPTAIPAWSTRAASTGTASSSRGNVPCAAPAATS